MVTARAKVQVTHCVDLDTGTIYHDRTEEQLIEPEAWTADGLGDLQGDHWENGTFHRRCSALLVDPKTMLAVQGGALYGVELREDQLAAMLGQSGPSAESSETGAMLRAPAVKAGLPPSDEAIVAKAKEMKARGMEGRDIAKNMRFEDGFEHVSTVAIRALIKGLWKGGRKSKNKAP